MKKRSLSMQNLLWEPTGLQETFLDALGRELEQAYPPESAGTLFPFRRIFVVAYRNVDCRKRH